MLGVQDSKSITRLLVRWQCKVQQLKLCTERNMMPAAVDNLLQLLRGAVTTGRKQAQVWCGELKDALIKHNPSQDIAEQLMCVS